MPLLALDRECGQGHYALRLRPEGGFIRLSVSLHGFQLSSGPLQFSHPLTLRSSQGRDL